MAQEFLPSDESESAQPTSPQQPETYQARERIKHLLIGSRATVKATINTLHVKGYAEVREWSKPQSAGVLGEPGEVISVLIRHITPE